MADENKKVTTEKAIVARGRSIDVQVPGRAIVVGTTEDNKPVTRAPTRRAGPGEEIELPSDEVRTLRLAGFLVDPANLPPPSGIGPGAMGDGPGQTYAA
jgi:hypothetical protein